MNTISKYLINLLRYVIISILVIVLIASVDLFNELKGDNFTNKFFFTEIFMILGGVIIISSKTSRLHKMYVLLLISFLLRVIWILSVNTMPTSDFNTMYEGAKILLTGDYSILKGFSYLARFPHLIPMTLYMAGIIKIFPAHNLIVLKLLNALFGTITIYFLYKLSSNFIKSDKNKLWILILAAIFPPFITYTSVLCTENLALPLYLLTLISFYKAKEGERIKEFFLSGCLLAVSNLFRGLGVVFLIAFIIYLLLLVKERKIYKIISLIAGYYIIMIGISSILVVNNIIEQPLWKGTEPGIITLLLKGSNFEEKGLWNLKDAEFIEKNLGNKNLGTLCLQEVKNRIFSKTPTQLLNFYFEKFTSQWRVGDCLGTFWAYSGVNMGKMNLTPVSFQIIYINILILAIIGEIKGLMSPNILINIILFGFITLFTIIETQPRYSYIVSWIFIILSSEGVDYIIKKVTKIAYKITVRN